MVEASASAAMRRVVSACGPSSASNRAAMSMIAVRICGSSRRGLILTLLHNVDMFKNTTVLCKGGQPPRARRLRGGDKRDGRTSSQHGPENGAGHRDNGPFARGRSAA